jgi:pimeloyl-ACP methyl ester carboxylesterase
MGVAEECGMGVKGKSGTIWLGAIVGGVFVALLPSARPASVLPKPQKVQFDTVDEVQLEGYFYGSEPEGKAPAVILLHDLGGSSQQAGWIQLAKKLQDNGFAVLMFDFRGHGNSTTVDPAFWRVPVNNRLKNANPKKQQISYKDFGAGYLPMLVNDIAAARRFLDGKNDGRECNTSNLVLIGAQEGATLGALWLASEWRRKPPRKDGEGSDQTPHGQDVAAAVWLSISPTLGGPRGATVRLDNWVRPLRDKTPMAFLFGEEDKASAALANQLVSVVLKADVPPRLKHTAARGLKTKVAGVDLIKSSAADDKILAYLQNVLEARDGPAWYDRETKKARVDFIPLKPFGFVSP